MSPVASTQPHGARLERAQLCRYHSPRPPRLPVLLFGNFGVLFDWWDQTGLVSLLVIPEFIWEAFLGIYCAIWGFRKDSPIVPPNWRGDAVA